MPINNTTTNWLCSGAFPSPPVPSLHSLATDYWPLFSRHRPLAAVPPPLATRSSGSAIDAARRAGYSTPHPAQGQHATKCYVSTPFRGVLPHPAAKSALRAEGATHSLAARKPGWPQRPPGQCSSSPRRPDQRGQVVRGPSPLATAIHRRPDWQRPNGARSRRAARLFQYVTEKAIRADKVNGFLPARRRWTVDHSLVAGGAQRQGIQTCRSDGHRPECLFSRRPPCE